MIRSYVKNIIFNALVFDIFRFEDFTIEERTVSAGDMITISNDIYFYRMCFNTSSSQCEITYCPGTILSRENETLRMVDLERQIPDNIHKWLIRIKNDLMNPIEERFINQKIEEFKEQLGDKLRNVDDSFFSKEESDALLQRLDMLEKMVLGENTEKEELSEEIKKMKEEIAFLKDTVDKLTRKRWLKNAVLKMWTWSQKPENRKLIEAGMDTVKAISKVDFPNIVD